LFLYRSAGSIPAARTTSPTMTALLIGLSFEAHEHVS